MSILNYQPTAGYRDTGRNARAFIDTHMDTFRYIFKPLAPFIAACLFLDIVITEHFMPAYPDSEIKHDFSGFSATIGNYFLACLVITWHRVIIHGPDRYTPVNPFKPTRSELVFMLAAIGLFVAVFLAAMAVTLIAGLLGPAIMGITLIALMFGAIFLFARCSFYFPAKATGNDLSMNQAFKLSEGYVLRLCFAPFYAMWRILLITIGYFALMMAIAFLVHATLPDLMDIPSISVVFQFLLTAPIYLYFSPLMTIAGVGVLSNFYQYALQNPSDKDTYIA